MVRDGQILWDRRANDFREWKSLSMRVIKTPILGESINFPSLQENGRIFLIFQKLPQRTTDLLHMVNPSNYTTEVDHGIKTIAPVWAQSVVAAHH